MAYLVCVLMTELQLWRCFMENCHLFSMNLHLWDHSVKKNMQDIEQHNVSFLSKHLNRRKVNTVVM